MITLACVSFYHYDKAYIERLAKGWKTGLCAEWYPAAQLDANWRVENWGVDIDPVDDGSTDTVIDIEPENIMDCEMHRMYIQISDNQTPPISFFQKMEKDHDFIIECHWHNAGEGYGYYSNGKWQYWDEEDAPQEIIEEWNF